MLFGKKKTSEFGTEVAEAFKDYLGDLNPAQLFHIGLDDRDRDIFCAAEIRALRDDKTYAYNITKSNTRQAVFHMPELCEDDDENDFLKAMIHEFGHRFADQRRLYDYRTGNMREKMGILRDYLKIKLAVGSEHSSKIIFKLGAFTLAAEMLLGRNDIGSGVIEFTSYMAANHYAGVKCSPFFREEEEDCDLFADLVMPQVPFQFSEQDDYSRLEKLLGIQSLAIHPPTPLRYERSQQLCAIFLEQSTKLNMPDFRDYFETAEPAPA